jgi:hypothetical protein
MSILGFSYTTQYSPLIPHLKLLLHVSYYLKNELEGNWEVVDSMENGNWMKRQGPVRDSVTLAPASILLARRV